MFGQEPDEQITKEDVKGKRMKQCGDGEGGDDGSQPKMTKAIFYSVSKLYLHFQPAGEAETEWGRNGIPRGHQASQRA